MLVSKAIEIMRDCILESSVISDCEIVGAVLDSRITETGNMFFACQGEYFDGNDYAEMALNLGASVVIMSNKEKYDETVGNKILVDCVITFMKKFGAFRLNEMHAIKIAITGSFGKTSSKEMLNKILSKRYKVYATRGNKNNLLGVNLTACGIDSKADIILMEIGSSASGEIAELAKLINPDIGIVTAIGHAHIGHFKSLENTIKEKLSIIEGIKNGGKLVIESEYYPKIHRFDVRTFTYGNNINDDVYVTELVHCGTEIKFKVNIFEGVVTLHHPYQHLVKNFLPLIVVAKGLLMQENDIIEAIGEYEVVSGRGNIIHVNNLAIIDDTYNAGYESIVKAIESLSHMTMEPKQAVIGEMGEVEGFEEKLHESVANLSDKYTNINFILVGNEYRRMPNKSNRIVITDKDMAFDEVGKIDSGVVVIKASHSKHFEDFVKFLANKHGAAE